MKKIPFNITFIKLALVSVLLQYMFLVFLVYKRRVFFFWWLNTHIGR